MGKALFVLSLTLLGLMVGLLLARTSSWHGGGAGPAQSAPPAEAPEDLEAQLAAARSAIATGHEFTLEIDEQEANRRLRAAGEQSIETPLGTARLVDPTVRFEAGQAVVEARGALGTIEAPLVAVFQVGLSERGEVAISVSRVDFGPTPLPAAARSAIERALQAHLEQALGQLPVRLSSIDVQPGRVLVTGVGGDAPS